MRRAGRSARAVLAALLLAGCAGAAAGAWSKPGADATATADAYRDCAALAETATRTDAQVDQDIAASRAADLQRASIMRAQAQQTAETGRDRAAAIVGSCMEAKGFTRRPQ